MNFEQLPKPIRDSFIEKHSQLLLDSYRRLTGKHLLPPQPDSGKIARNLFEAPFVVVSSDNSPDPILNYGNALGLGLWEMDWDTLTKTPGRKTAEPMHQSERDRFLETVKNQGFIDNYSGVRISKNGKRFKIENATVWNLTGANGNYLGQAATFATVTPLV